jgi:hypothetical protein
MKMGMNLNITVEGVMEQLIAELNKANEELLHMKLRTTDG